MGNSITKEKILEKVNSYHILNHYLQPYNNNMRLIAGKNISNPFLPNKQNTPSFNIFPGLPDHEWRYKDFATGDEGSCFDLVMKLKNLSFPEALETINHDLCLDIDHPPNTNKQLNGLQPNNNNFAVLPRPFTQRELDFWLQYGISEATLKRYNVLAVDSFTAQAKNGSKYTIKSTPDKFIFAYKLGEAYKLYKPLDDKQFKFQHLGHRSPDHIFGLDQLPERGDQLILTGGEKDVMSLASHGYSAIALNSETAKLPSGLVSKLSPRFSNLFVLYDNDDTGIRQSQNIASSSPFLALRLPDNPQIGKDISDFFASGFSASDLNKRISETLAKIPEPGVSHEKAIYTAEELLSMGITEPEYLMVPIFPKVGTAVLAGKPDTGKSQFARMLCIKVASSADRFIEFELTPTHHRALYVATEDNIEATRYLISRQTTGLNKEDVKNLSFLFADTLSQEEILTEIDKHLSECPVDLVVVDSFGDIFTGSDGNNNMAVRKTVSTFNKVARKHNCLVLFVHHINKSAYKLGPSQEHIQGGASLVQKVRLAIQLTEGEGNIRYLTITKGNYCPKEFKENSIELEFSETNFLFTPTGKKVPTSSLGAQPGNEKKEERYDYLKHIAGNIFKDKELSYSQFVKAFTDLTHKSVPTAKRAHTQLIKLEFIAKTSNGHYRLSDNYYDDGDIDGIEDLPDVEDEGMPF
jgi:KaiC/GvpD/RAD55 family RecA-like ATPase